MDSNKNRRCTRTQILNEQLCHAASHGQVEGIQSLVPSGAELNSGYPSNFFPTPLMLASQGGHLPALMSASFNGHSPVVQCLLNAKADPASTKVNQFGESALSLATKQQQFLIVSQIIERAERMNEEVARNATQSSNMTATMDTTEGENDGRPQQGNAKRARPS